MKYQDHTIAVLKQEISPKSDIKIQLSIYMANREKSDMHVRYQTSESGIVDMRTPCFSFIAVPLLFTVYIIRQ